MKKIIPLSFYLLMATVVGAQSPITLSNANMPSSGDTLRYSNGQINSVGNYTQTGTNFTWNFANLNPTSQGVRNYKAALLTPYAFFFLGFNEYGEKIADTLGAGPLVMTNYYNYYKKQSTPVNAYIADGVGLTFSSIPVPSYYSDKDELYNFPMSYPKYDSTTFKFSTASNTMIPIKYSKTGSRVTVVDGWGSVTTPFGTANCLRLITTQYSQDSIKNNLIPFPFGFPNNQRSYQWMTTSSKIPFLEISGNLVGGNFTITQVRYRDSYRVITGVEKREDISALAIYPNPVKDQLHLLLAKGKSCKIEITDVNGQLIRSEQLETANGGLQSINVTNLEAGLYIITIKGDTNNSYFKFIKE
jgi:hypothetical protein